jgi:predicted Ser/Thr protein kinase
MTPERWQQLKALFHAALDLPREQRDAWVRAHSQDDEALSVEVMALLRDHDAAGHVLDVPLATHIRSMTPELIGAEEQPLALGSEIGSFRIEAELGRGGMGVVYKAFDDRLGRVVALKVLAGAAAADPVRRKRLQNEALLAATIHHRGVAEVYRLEEISGDLFLATEFVAGQSLRQVADCGALGLVRALTLTRDILRALGAAHAAGIIHRDLKPENVMVGPDDTVKIVDFGIARSDRFAMTRVTSGTAPGTPAYMAPEQLAGADADSRADLYAVGVILAELVSGQHPGVPAQTPLPWQLQAIIDRALTRSPAERFQSASDMLHALDALHTSAGSTDRVALGWWRFHQITAAVVYWLMLIPSWTARQVIGGQAGRVLFFVLLATVVISSLLRLHLCFTSFYYARQLLTMRSQASLAVRLGDAVFVGVLALIGAAIGEGHFALTVLMVSVAVGAGVAAVVIEPATTRAAFER